MDGVDDLGTRADELAHLGVELTGGELALVEIEDAGVFVLVLDLVAALFLSLVHVLVALHFGVEDGVAGAAETEDEVARRTVGDVEVLVVGGAVRGRVERAGLPVDADGVDGVFAFKPEQRVAFAGGAPGALVGVVKVKIEQ